MDSGGTPIGNGFQWLLLTLEKKHELVVAVPLLMWYKPASSQDLLPPFESAVELANCF